MMKHTKALLTTLGALMLAPLTAQAVEDHDPHWSAMGLIGYGFKDGANFGLGARVGYTLEQNIYIGGNLMYHFGHDYGPGTVNLYYFGVEGGYDFQVRDVTIRPYLGLGPAWLHGSSDTACIAGVGCVNPNVSRSESYFAIWPAVDVVYNLNEQWFIGGDFRLPIVNGDVYATLSFTGGLNF
jgi:hypothetical protein